MRLGTCIALELVVAAGVVGGAWFGVRRAGALAGAYLVSQEALAATAVPRPALRAPEPLPRAHLVVARPAPATVFGAPDGELLAPLGTSPITGVELNHGGTSLSLRIEYASGARAAFKPEQIHTQSDPRREIAAYVVDRLLEIGRVPPAKATVITVAELLAAAAPSHRAYIARRIAEEARPRDGVLHGELSWWVPRLAFATIGGHLVESEQGKALWASYLQVGAQIPAPERPLVAQIAAVLLFDVLIDNPDRWTGGNTLMSPDRQIFYFMDNTLSFSHFELGRGKCTRALWRIQVFPRQLVERLRTLTYEQVVAALTAGDHLGLGPLLDDAEIRAMLKRRDSILRYVDLLIAQHGEPAVLALP